MKEKCKQCQGQGKIRTTVPLQMTVPCLRCLGTGQSEPFPTEPNTSGFLLLFRYLRQIVSKWIGKDGERQGRD